MPSTGMNPETLKSERSAKIRMTKLEGRWNDAHGAKVLIIQKGNEEGWDDARFVERDAAQAVESAIVDEMRALADAASKRGWYVKGSLLRYWDSPTAALVAANID